MNKKSLLRLLSGSLMAVFLFLGSCRREVDIPLPALVGNPGNPRFNLKFTNDANVDLDLYVVDPNGETIYYRNRFARASLGQLDVDCRCSYCPQGPNENIFWPVTGQSPRGKYEFWVNYYAYCTTRQPSSFTVRVTNDAKALNAILFTATGSLSGSGSTGINSTHWIYDTATGSVTPK